MRANKFNLQCQKSFYQGESSSSIFLKKLQNNLEDMSEQLQESNAKNIELSKLIEILTEERNYYQQQLKKSELSRKIVQQSLKKQRQELQSKNLLIAQLKKANRQLSSQLENVHESLQETKFLFEAQQQQIERIRQQKQLIETEWNRVIKQVNTKMVKIQRKQQQSQKQNLQFFCNLPLKQKVQKALKSIDREIELQNRTRKGITNISSRQSTNKVQSQSSTSGNEVWEENQY